MLICKGGRRAYKDLSCYARPQHCQAGVQREPDRSPEFTKEKSERNAPSHRTVFFPSDAVWLSPGRSTCFILDYWRGQLFGVQKANVFTAPKMRLLAVTFFAKNGAALTKSNTFASVTEWQDSGEHGY